MFALEAEDASSMLLDELASLTLVHHAALLLQHMMAYGLALSCGYSA